MLRSGLAFLVVLGVLVFIHELGHYLAARWRGVHVEAFSIGFGQALASWTDRSGTIWKLAWIPLGGYVKLHGQERPQDVPAKVRATWIPGRTFHEKPVLSRMIIVAAGPAANFVLAMVLFTGLFAIAGKPAVPVVSEVRTNSAAAHAGFAPGDQIEAINGAHVDSFEDVQRMVSARPGEPLTVRVLRDGQDRDLQIVTETEVSGGRRVGVMGVRGSNTAFVRVPPLEAIRDGAVQTWDVTAQTVVGVSQMITGRRGTDDIGGPLRIAQLSGQVAELGLASLVSFIAVLSVNLGLINLIPIPLLDGGHLLFYLAEAVRGRPISPRAQEYGFRAGLALLVSLFIFATWNDLTHLGLFRWVAGLIG
ncbi:MAG: RIP metalloprotease RseP [Acetobacteraceae bacterium]|nr:RIP metalloprotease RseP [Acetobacteraceae bacterium]MBV8523038.1 RIP metalloprotease RseP [Acetobacteraceae bacterium]